MQKPLVMIVDDEAPFVETMTKRLEKRDLRILSALSGEEALEKLGKNQNTDVVILDVKMPGMDGVETRKRIKRDFPLIEVIMLTGHGTIESAIEGMKLGAFDYLLKPCEIEDLQAKILQAVEKRREHEERIKQAKVRDALIRHGAS